jgi:cytochrome P450 family 82 subfamily G polypeptide 1
MDLPSYFQFIASILALLIVQFVSRSIKSPNRQKKITLFNVEDNKVPEPCCALPFIGHLHLLSIKEPYFRTFSTMAEKYGSVFSLRLGCLNTLVVSSREIAKECLTKNDQVFASRPNVAAGRYLGYNNAILALAPYGNYWRNMRKIATIELLSSHRLEKLKHVRDLEIYSLLKNLYTFVKNSNGAIEVPISKYLDHMTFNIIVRMIAGKRFGGETINQEDSEAWRLRNAIKDATYLSGVFVLADAIPFLSWFDFQGHVGFMKRTFKEMDFILDKWMHEHFRKRDEGQNGKSQDDFMDVLISMFEEHDEICGHKREVVIKATAMILILTASGSTAITLGWALSLLINHPKVLKQAQQELDTNIGKHKWVQESDIKDLKYLQSIIKETLRLYPPAPLTGIREATDDCHVASYHIPKGTRLLINLWKLQRDPQIWSNPNEFQPERFYNTFDQQVDSQNQDFGYVPFSYGRRSCAGATFGLQVLHLTLARLIQGFDIYTKECVVDVNEGLGLALPKENPLEVMLQPRLPLELYENL